MIMMLGHDGKGGGKVGGELKNVLFLEYSFAQQKLQVYFVGQSQHFAD